MYVSIFKVNGTDVAQSGVTSVSVVEDFNVLKDAQARLLFGLIFVFFDQFGFQAGEELFDTGIVPAIPLATHRDLNLMGRQIVLVSRAGVKTIAIGMMQKVVRIVSCC